MIDPSRIPQRTLYTDACIPAIGLETFDSDHVCYQQVTKAVPAAANDIEVIADCSIGLPNRLERTRTPEDANPQDPVIVKISQRPGKHPATVCIKWAIQRGQVPILMSVNPKNYLANLQAAITEALTEQDMTDIASIDRDCRLIKGQVFLWKEHQNWPDVWDEDGVIVQ